MSALSRDHASGVLTHEESTKQKERRLVLH